MLFAKFFISLVIIVFNPVVVTMKHTCNKKTEQTTYKRIRIGFPNKETNNKDGF